MQRLTILFIALFLFSCKSSEKATATIQPAEKAAFVMLQINDVYEISALEGGDVGGFARVATLRKQLMSENEHVITVLSGDFLNPSALGLAEVNGERLRGKQMVDVMNRLGIDYVTFGNHEFDLGEEDLQDRINESVFRWISSNTFHHASNSDGSRQVEPFILQGKMPEPVRPYDIINIPVAGRPDLKIGLLGVCLPFNQVDYVSYHDVIRSAKLTYEYIEGKTDAVIAMTHLNLPEDQDLARALPQVPLLMGGHEHENHFEQIGPVSIAKADANAKSAYVHYLSYDFASKSLNIKSQLVMLNETFEQDKDLLKVIDGWEGRVRDEMRRQGFNPDEVVYRATEELDGLEIHIRTRQTNLGELITKGAQASAPKAQATIVNSGSIRIDDKVKGPVTQYDVMRFLPYGGSMVEIDIDGALLQKVLKTGLYDNVGSGGYLQVYGVNDQNGSFFIDGKKVEAGTSAHSDR
ncbi:MAG: bifunctional metallophosphatase/5'-nucleotidase [Bacteroidia bacterium]